MRPVMVWGSGSVATALHEGLECLGFPVLDDFEMAVDEAVNVWFLCQQDDTLALHRVESLLRRAWPCGPVLLVLTGITNGSTLVAIEDRLLRERRTDLLPVLWVSELRPGQEVLDLLLPRRMLFSTLRAEARARFQSFFSFSGLLQEGWEHIPAWALNPAEPRPFAA